MTENGATNRTQEPVELTDEQRSILRTYYDAAMEAQQARDKAVKTFGDLVRALGGEGAQAVPTPDGSMRVVRPGEESEETPTTHPGRGG